MTTDALAADDDAEAEELARLLARICYEQWTGEDWHTAVLDPGTDPVWRARARARQEEFNRRHPVH